MNFFFGISCNNFSCQLTIPKFTNNNKKTKNLVPYQCYIENNFWKFEKANFSDNKNFFFIDNSQIKNNFFF